MNRNRLNPYATAMTGTTMVEIQCPHCEEDIELEDGASGLFDCPYCDNEFSFGDNELVAPTLFRPSQPFMSMGMKIGLAIIALGVITFIGFLIFEDGGGGTWNNYAATVIPCGILAIGIPIVVISFFIRGYQLNWEV